MSVPIRATPSIIYSGVAHMSLILYALYVLALTNLSSSTTAFVVVVVGQHNHDVGTVSADTCCPLISHLGRRRKINKLCRRRSDRFYDDEYADDDDYLSEGRVDDLGDFRSKTGLDLPSSYGRRDGWRLPESVSKSLLAGVFVLGIGLGVTIDSQVNTNPKDLASRDAIDNAAPNPTLCAKMGASAMAFDQRVFVSFNPFNVYVSQADVKPACVLLEANVVPVLRARGLINDNEVRSCKQNMNTWAFVGSLDDTPQLSCVYKSQDAQNEFLSNPKLGIGEDYLDDDLARIDTRKNVKDGLTEAQKQLLRNQMLKDRQSS